MTQRLQCMSMHIGTKTNFFLRKRGMSLTHDLTDLKPEVVRVVKKCEVNTW